METKTKLKRKNKPKRKSHWPPLAATLTFWPQNLISTSVNPDTSVTKIGWNSLQWFMRYGVHKVFRTHSLTHRRTNPITECLLHCFSMVTQA